jgi:hypothetical protein
LLPDVIVHWEHTTLLEPLEVDGLHDVPPAIARSRTGQHTSNAFMVAVGPAADHLGDIDKIEHLYKAIVGPLGAAS